MIRQYYTTFPAMGSRFQIWLETEADGTAILQQVPDQVEAIEARLSRFRETSELCQLNARSGLKTEASATLLDVLLAALDAAQYTGGLYTPLILPALLAAGYDRSFELIHNRAAAQAAQPQFALLLPDWQDVEVFIEESAVRLPPGAQLDFGGMGKGWTAEHLADQLEPFGPCLVDAGGDMVARGKPLGHTGWPVAVADPLSDGQPLIWLELADRAVATSGTDRRRWQRAGKLHHHLIDPRTGQPALTDVLAATVIDVDADRAEALAKTLVILGSEAGLQWFTEHSTGCAVVVLEDGAALATANIETWLAPADHETLIVKEHIQ